MAKRLMLFLAVLLVVLFTAGMVWSAKQNPDLLKPDRPIRGDESSFDYLITKASTVFPNAFCEETTILSPYDTCIGCTWYDYQHNSRIPRMCANDYQTIAAGGHGHHYSFMYQDAWGDAGKRYINVTYYDADYGWETIPAPVITAQGYRAGYCGMNIFLDGRSVPYYHTTGVVAPNPNDLGTVISIEPNLPGKLEFKNNKYWYDIPDSVNTEFIGMWPAADVDFDDQIHIVMNEGDTAAGISWMGYVRCTEGPDSGQITCQSPGLPIYIINKETPYWNPINRCMAFDSAGVIGANLTCSRVSNKVAICYAALAETEDDSTLYQVSNDAFYLESTNGGDNWFSDPDSMQFRRNCSQYKVTDKMRCYGEVTAVYDFNDDLHVYWYTHYYDKVANEVDINDIALWHFSENTVRFCDGESVYANKITAANWEEATAGAWNRLIAKITSGVGILEGDNENYLYITWTQFDTAKWNDAGNQTQGDLYTTVSTDAGMTWMIPVNITNSTVDSCVAGQCASDHWGSMAERVDDYLHLQWIYDLDVGGAVQDEGEPTNNPVLVYDFPKSSIPLENKARIGWTPSDFIIPYVHCPKNGQTTTTLTVENIGTATLSSISLSESATWLSIGTCPSSIVAGGCPAKVTLTITGQGAEEFYVDSIHVTSNDQAGNNDFYVRLHVVMSDVYVTEEDTTIDNPTMYVGFANVGNLGDQTDTTGYYLHQDDNEPYFLYDGTVLLAFTDSNIPADSLVGRWIFDEHYLLPERDAIVTDNAQLKTKIVDAEFSPTTPQAPLPWHHRWWYWTIRTKDYMFYSQSATENLEQYVTLRYIKLYYNPPPPWWPDITPPTSIPVTYVGMGLDIDAPSDSGAWNYPGIDESRRMAFLRGYGGTNENYRMAIAQRDTCYWTIGPVGPVYCCWPDPGIITKDIPFAMHVLRNDSTVYPHGGYYDPELYKWMSMPGDSILPDSSGDTPPEDYNIITTGRIIPAGTFPPVDTYEVAYALVVADEYEIDKMNDIVDMVMCGNANRDQAVTIADVVYIVSFLFKSGAEPWVYAADVNASGDVTIADCVYLVSYLFKSGPPPQCSKDWKP